MVAVVELLLVVVVEVKMFHGVLAPFNFADGHTVSNAPDLFRPPKLSSTGPG